MVTIRDNTDYVRVLLTYVLSILLTYIPSIPLLRGGGPPTVYLLPLGAFAALRFRRIRLLIPRLRLYWLAVEELTLSYHNGHMW